MNKQARLDGMGSPASVRRRERRGQQEVMDSAGENKAEEQLQAHATEVTYQPGHVAVLPKQARRGRNAQMAEADSATEAGKQQQELEIAVQPEVAETTRKKARRSLRGQSELLDTAAEGGDEHLQEIPEVAAKPSPIVVSPRIRRGKRKAQQEAEDSAGKVEAGSENPEDLDQPKQKKNRRAFTSSIDKPAGKGA